MACFARCVIQIIRFFFKDYWHTDIKNCVSPFCRSSKCSQRISPTKGGALAWKASFPIAQISLPFIWNWCKAMPSKENSFIAHCIQWATWFSVHCRGSKKKPLKPNKWRFQISQACLAFEKWKMLANTRVSLCVCICVIDRRTIHGQSTEYFHIKVKICNYAYWNNRGLHYKRL